MMLSFTRSAQQDLERLREFIAKHNPDAARRIGQRLLQSIKRLTEQPSMGVEVESLQGIQDLVIGDYIVRYTVIGQGIVILRIWHGREER